jgi:(2Fe-2S) ferredoxin/precorrin-6B methylase 2
MEPFKYHVYVCIQEKPEGVPCCSSRGSKELLEALRREVGKQGLSDDVQITTSGSIGLCQWGPNLIVYPEGTWYSGVTVADVPEIVAEHFKSGRPVERLVKRDNDELRAEIETNRARMLAAMKAKDKAGVLPDELSEQLRAFRDSRVLLTAVELDVFTAVGDGGTGEEVAEKRDLDPRATDMLLNALVALGVLNKKEGHFENTPLSSRFLVAGSSDDSRLGLMHSVHLWDRWSTLTDCIREGTSVTYKKMADRAEDWTRAFIAAMHKNAALRANVVVQALGDGPFNRLLDVGGGSGAYSIAFCKAHKDLKAVVFDLENVLPLTEKYVGKAGLSDRIEFEKGDLHEDDFGTGYDLVLLSAICHMNSPDENRRLLEKAFGALESGGRIVIQDFVLEPDRTQPKTATLFALNMLVGTKAGNSYSIDEYTAWLQAAGFGEVAHIRLPGPTGLVVGVKN